MVTIPGMIDNADLAPLREVSDVTYRESSAVSEEELAALCAGFDYLMLNYDVIKHLSPSFYEHGSVRALRAVSADITGMDWASPEAAHLAGVPLLNIPHYSTESVAETYLAEVFLHTRQRHLAYVDKLKGRPYKERKGINVLGKTAGIVGLGSIGCRVGELLANLGMDVIAWNRTPKDTFRSVSLAEMFESAQVICICVKTVREGEHRNVGIIGTGLLSRCRNTVIVNLANRDLVDNAAMLDALQNEHVAAYSVERSDELEALFAAFEQVHLPPSISWLSDESLQMLRHVWVRNILDALDDRYVNLVTA